MDLEELFGVWNMEDIVGSIDKNQMDDFNPDDYSVEVDIQSPAVDMGWEELPKYTVDELKMDIEPMLYDLELEDITDLMKWIMDTWTMMKSWNYPHPQKEEEPMSNAEQEIPDFEPFENTDVDMLTMLQ